MRDWSGSAHVRTLRQWPVLEQTVERIEARPDRFAGAFLYGSLSRGDGDALSDVDLAAVAADWDAAWAVRNEISEGALVAWDRLEPPKTGIGGHMWLTSDLVKVELLVTEPGKMVLHGPVHVIVGDRSLVDGFARKPQFERAEIDAYAAELRRTDALDPIERAHGDLMAVLHARVRQ